MCRKLVVVNELVLGNRVLGFEALALPKGEIVEFTPKQLKDMISGGKDEVYGVTVSESTEELVPDNSFFCKNWMIKSHINSLVPKYECESLVNLFYIVIGTHKEKGVPVYDVVSSRYERTSFGEEKIRTLIDMDIVSAGAMVVDDKVVVAPLEKKVVENVGEVAP